MSTPNKTLDRNRAQAIADKIEQISARLPDLYKDGPTDIYMVNLDQLRNILYFNRDLIVAALRSFRP